MDLFHCCLHELLGCVATDRSFCFCKDLLLEQITFFMQTSCLMDEFLTLVEQCKQFNNLSISGYYATTTTEANNLLEVLTAILNLVGKFNTELSEHLVTTTFDVNYYTNLLNNCEIFEEIQRAIISVFCAFDLEASLQPILYVYLCLELEAVEAESEDNNIFASAISTNMTDQKLKIMKFARSLTESNQLVKWPSFYKSLFIPFIKESLLYRTKLLCSENYSEQFLDAIIKYQKFVLKRALLPRLFCKKSDLVEIGAQLSDDIVYKTFYSIHKPELFSLVIEYPDSVAALVDLGKCLDHLPVRHDLITHLTEEVQQRLLHPGVHTEQILVAYSYLVRALRLIDNTFLVQDIVCKPVSSCLRQREDAVRCIVDKLISAPDVDGVDDDTKMDECIDSTTELHQELLLPKPLEVEPLDCGDDSDGDIVAEDPPFDSETTLLSSSIGCTKSQIIWGSDWKPDPMEALCQRGLWRRRLDLLSMLVSIYGSKKAFLVEYKQLLSQRLLRQRSFHTARELKNLELLKLRFGEQNLHECEVMLKDIRDSKRIANLVAESSFCGYLESDSNNKLTAINIDESKLNGDSKPTIENQTNKFSLSAFILSIHYWPELLDDKFKLPSEFFPVFDNYERCFQRLKGNRTLQWMHKLGLVNIDLSLGNHCVQLDVTPLQASIVHLFTKNRIWCLRDLAQELGTQISTVRSSIQLYVQLGFLRANSNDESALGCNRSEMISENYEVCNEIHPSSESSNEHSCNAENVRLDTDSSVNTNPWVYSCQDDTNETDSLVSSIRDRREKEMKVFWSYIVAMLTNLGSLSLDRIHSMLRMFASGSATSNEFTREELRRFLDQKIRESHLFCDGDMYKLVSLDN